MTKRLVFVEWYDSASTDGWRKVGVHEPIDVEDLLCSSVGWVVEESPDVLVISSHLSHKRGGEINQIHSDMAIPKLAIKRVKTLHLPKGVTL